MDDKKRPIDMKTANSVSGGSALRHDQHLGDEANADDCRPSQSCRTSNKCTSVVEHQLVRHALLYRQDESLRYAEPRSPACIEPPVVVVEYAHMLHGQCSARLSPDSRSGCACRHSQSSMRVEHETDDLLQQVDSNRCAQ